jgi:hypothetical protein
MAGYLLVLYGVHKLPLTDRIFTFSYRCATVNLEKKCGVNRDRIADVVAAEAFLSPLHK